jgi:HEAT repeat protein
MEAALALGHIGSEAKEAVPALIKTLGDPEVGVQEFAIASLGPEAKEAVPALIKVLGDRWQAVRWRAAYALGDIGPEAKQAIPELERVAEEDPDGLVRQNAHDALEKIRK